MNSDGLNSERRVGPRDEGGWATERKQGGGGDGINSTGVEGRGRLGDGTGAEGRREHVRG